MNSVTSADIQAVKQRLGIVGTSPSLQEAIGRALRVAPIDLSVLIIGESGTGKEFFPKIIHGAGARKHARYIAVNCGAIPEGTIDSELFGHEKGSFTGAIGSRKGYFEEADGGTIFLDEVAELPLTTQARLLRVLETGEFIKVGSSQVQKTNIRVVAATNVDMAQAVAEGRFREDLYYRLSTVQINVPPLRDRGDDVELLTRFFANAFSERYQTPELRLDADARLLMRTYRWPGNVRQLKNIVEQLSLFEGGETVSRATLESYLPMTVYAPAVMSASAAGGGNSDYGKERDILFNMIFSLRSEVDRLRSELDARDSGGSIAPRRDAAPSAGALISLKSERFENPEFSEFSDLTDSPVGEVQQPMKTLEESEKEMIREALERNGGRRKQTAAELNISERTLYRKIKDYDLE